MIKVIFNILKVIFTVIIIFYLIKFVDFNRLKNIILNANQKLLLLSIILLFLVTILQAIRFSFVLKYFEISINIFNSWKNISLGILYNQVLPSTIGGDTVRFVNMKELKLTTQDSISSIIIDRFYGLLALCFICGIGSFLLFNLNYDKKFLIITQLLTFSSIGLYILYPFILRKYISSFFKKIRISKLIDQIYFPNLKTTIFKILIISLIIHFFLALVGYIILQALKINIQMELWPFIWIFLSSLLISTIPISIGGWGFREGVFIISFRMIGIDSETAMALSFIYAIETSIIGFVGGVLWSLKFFKN